jgi:hypothetical protein
MFERYIQQPQQQEQMATATATTDKFKYQGMLTTSTKNSMYM